MLAASKASKAISLEIMANVPRLLRGIKLSYEVIEEDINQILAAKPAPMRALLPVGAARQARRRQWNVSPVTHVSLPLDCGEHAMLWTIVVILLVLWLLGFSLHIGAGLIHILLVVALVVGLIQLFSGRRVV